MIVHMFYFLQVYLGCLVLRSVQHIFFFLSRSHFTAFFPDFFQRGKFAPLSSQVVKRNNFIFLSLCAYRKRRKNTLHCCVGPRHGVEQWRCQNSQLTRLKILVETPKLFISLINYTVDLEQYYNDLGSPRTSRFYINKFWLVETPNFLK